MRRQLRSRPTRNVGVGVETAGQLLEDMRTRSVAISCTRLGDRSDTDAGFVLVIKPWPSDARSAVPGDNSASTRARQVRV
jgi:hypothetical protein